ncbi:hypothetical protein ASE75_10690 [Sphingomonas sp. Leaf17]|uniref:head-tail connector protein n=1 Tax=Sphingomonas sp. Leaf17 TaxID=1735683 RepID=UPI0006FA02B4|nr:hypothetical protein [Sphingomonas sp. Leaf17]KQM64424.1 hypothetical protein ASE75_10690 [Sphingomonas sp. Leaf17]
MRTELGAGVPASAIAEAVVATRAFLRSGETGEDTVLARAAGSAFALAEAFIGAVPIVAMQEDVLTVSGGWQRLARAPVQAIAGVTGLPAGAAPFVLPVGAYAIDIDGTGHGWVRVAAPGDAARVAVAYSAGLAGDWATLPMGIAQGIVMLTAHLVDQRGSGAGPPAAVAALWRPWRRVVMTPARPVRA